MTLIAAPTAAHPSVDPTARLLVTCRDAGTGRYRPVGFLYDLPGRGYSFAYLVSELQRDGFRPLPGLARAVKAPVNSPELFPVFAERVIGTRRPDRRTSLEALGLPDQAEAFEILARSHGQRVGDTIELLPAPTGEVGDTVSTTFLTHGVRYLPPQNQERISTLSPGDSLRLRPEPTNKWNPRAHIVTDLEDLELGWVPDPLLDVIDQLDDHRLTVERANGPEVGFHFRLLVRLDGRVSKGALFTGAQWDIVP